MHIFGIRKEKEINKRGEKGKNRPGVVNLEKKKIIKMAKKTKNKEIWMIAGIVLLLIGLIGFRDLISVLLVVVGGYLVYKGLKKS